MSVHGVLTIIQEVHSCQKFGCIFSHRPGMSEMSETNNGVNSGGVVTINGLQLTLECGVIKAKRVQRILGNGMSPLECIVNKMPKHKQDFCVVIPKYGGTQVKSQFTLGKEVLEF